MSKLRFKVSYYNEEHKRLLSTLDCFDAIEHLVEEGLIVEQEEFLIYSLFREQKNQPGFRTYEELRAKLLSRLFAFNDYFDLDSETVRSKFPPGQDTDTTHTEAAGVGATLTLTSRLFGLTEADWEKIPKSQNKDLDFQIASTGKEFVEVEAKGTVVDQGKITTGISNHRASIEAKKIEQREKFGNNNILLGVIASFPFKNELIAQCRVLDPPAFDVPFDPRKYKLIARSIFYWRELSLITQSPFLIALINKIQSIASSRDYDNLDRVPLLNSKGHEFTIPNSWLSDRTIVGDTAAFGEVFPINRFEFYFYGLDFSIIDILVQQDFDDLLDFSSKIGRQYESVNVMARVRKSELADMRIDFRGFKETSDNSRVEIPMCGQLFTNSAGRMIGKLLLSQKSFL